MAPEFLSPREKRILMEEAVAPLSPRQRIETADAALASLSRRQKISLYLRGPWTMLTYHWRARRWRKEWGQ